jgi:hypothetical protein
MIPEKSNQKEESTHIVFVRQTDSAAVSQDTRLNTTDASANTETQLTDSNKNKASIDDSKEQNTTIHISYVSILILLVFVVGMLLMLYFFYNVMSKSLSLNSLFFAILISINDFNFFFSQFISYSLFSASVQRRLFTASVV